MIEAERSQLRLQVQVDVRVLDLDIFEVVCDGNVMSLHQGCEEKPDLLALGRAILEALIVWLQIVELRISNYDVHYEFFFEVPAGESLRQVYLT